MVPIRVTEVLNYFKEPWYIDWVHRVGRTEANKISKASMKVGTEVDKIIKENVSGNYLPEKHKNKEVENCIEAYKKWFKVYQPKSITPCTRLYSTIEGHEVTGEPDLMVDGVLVDIKCSSKISPSYWLQVNMYSILHNIQANNLDFDTVYKLLKLKKPHKVGILRFDKITASYEYVLQDYSPSLVDCWVGLMRAFYYYKGEDNGGLDVQEG